MDAVCPTESSVYRRRLCVLLLSGDSVAEVEYRDALREFARKSDQPRVRFGYVYPERQRDFFNALVSGEWQNQVLFCTYSGITSIVPVI